MFRTGFLSIIRSPVL